MKKPICQNCGFSIAALPEPVKDILDDKLFYCINCKRVTYDEGECLDLIYCGHDLECKIVQ